MFLQWPQWKPYKFLTRFSLSSLVKFAVQHVSELHALHSAYSSPAGDDVFLWKIVGKHCSAFTDPITSTIRHRICIKTLPNILKWSSEVECAERLKYYKTHKLEVWEVLFKEVTCTHWSNSRLDRAISPIKSEANFNLRTFTSGAPKAWNQYGRSIENVVR